MMLPIQPVTIPTVLAGETNGKLPASILLDTPGQAGGVPVRLVRPAARAWRALAAAALDAGHILKATSVYDSYRPYEIQERIFKQRYTTSPLPGQPRRWWQGQWWYLIEGNAPAAIPGTSNHGWGLAVDVGEERDGDTGTESMDAATLAWLVTNELRFGFSHELAVEPWHIRYTRGDDIPAAVLEYEEGDVDEATFKEWWGKAAHEQQIGRTGKSFAVTFDETLDGVTALNARPPVESAPVDGVALQAAVEAAVAAKIPAIVEAVIDAFGARLAE